MDHKFLFCIEFGSYFWIPKIINLESGSFSSQTSPPPSPPSSPARSISIRIVFSKSRKLDAQHGATEEEHARALDKGNPGGQRKLHGPHDRALLLAGKVH